MSNALFGKVEITMWCDEKYRKLSPIARCLWTFLVAGPSISRIPGVHKMGLSGLAEQADFTLDQTQLAWAEIEALDLARADWGKLLVWLPRSLAKHPPSTVRQVRAWEADLANLPKCPLSEAISLNVAEVVQSTFGTKISPEKNVPSEQIKIKIKTKTKTVKNDPMFSLAQSGNGSFSHSELFDLWNEKAMEHKGILAKVTQLTTERKRKMSIRIKEQPSKEFWENVISTIYATPFLLGENDHKWRVSFDWIIQNEDNAVKIVEGKYDRADPNPPPKSGSSSWADRAYVPFVKKEYNL